jgi:hypothetical protein
MSPQDREELKRLKAKRKALVAQWGNRGQLHPWSRMMGGLNPGAQELAGVRRQIEAIEARHRAPAPTLTPLGSGHGWDRRGGLLYNVEFNGRRGQIGRSQGAPPHDLYIVEGGAFVSGGYKTVGQAAKAFAAHVRSK